MQINKLNKFLVLALMMFAAFQIGCGDPDANLAVNPGSPTTPPTVTAVTPPTGTTGVCPNGTIISATFSKPMNPATLNTSTFTLTSGAGAVSGTVSYVVATQTATFTPSPTLALN